LIPKELKVLMHAVRLASALALAAVLTVSARPSAEVIEQVVIKVNGDIITKTELEQRQVAALRGRGIQPSDDAALKKAIEEITPALLVDTIDEMLLVQRGRELGYKMTDEDFNRVVGNIRKENKLDSDEAFQAALKQEGMTVADLRKSLERQMLIARVQQNEVMAKVSVNEEEARKYHAEHVTDFTKPGSVTIRELLITVPKDAKGINVAADEDAKAKAEAARKRILAGDAFEQVATEVSQSPSRANGGLVGPLNVSELSPAFQQLLKGMKPGDVSEVLRGSSGWQVIKLETQTPDEVQTAEQAHDKIADALYEQKRKVEQQKYLTKLRDQAIIEWKNDDLKKAWLAQLKTEGTQPAAPAPPTVPPSAPAAEKPPTR
jgi:peptidyl-prolyl cis-trans isomerase SurA